MKWIRAPGLAESWTAEKWSVTLGKNDSSLAVDHAEARQSTLARFGK
ncbi:hypothetical protein [Paraburkholderia sartisoli]|nr:hypothetical protein [Paraburkholderia sartisoli]